MLYMITLAAIAIFWAVVYIVGTIVAIFAAVLIISAIVLATRGVWYVMGRMNDENRIERDRRAMVAKRVVETGSREVSTIEHG